MPRFMTRLMALTVILYASTSFGGVASDDSYAYTSSRVIGGTEYFVGRKRVSEKYNERAPWRIMKRDLTTGVVTEILPSEEFEKLDPAGGKSMPSTNLAVDQHERWLAGGIWSTPSVKEEPQLLHENSIFIVDLARRRVRYIHDDHRDNRDLFFSPDGRYLYFRSHSRETQQRCWVDMPAELDRVCLMDMNDGKVTVLSHPKPGLVGRGCWWSEPDPPAWSPDSRRIVFHRFLPDSEKIPGERFLELLVGDVNTMKSRRIGYRKYSAGKQFIDNDRFVELTPAGLGIVDLNGDKNTILVPKGRMPLKIVKLEGGEIVYEEGVSTSTQVKRVRIPPK